MKILLKTYPELNLGDDLFLKIILERYPNVHFKMLANKKQYGSFLSTYRNLDIIDRLEHISLFDRLILRTCISFKISNSLQEKIYKRFIKKQYGTAFHDSDLFVTIGGSMFIENSTDRVNKNIIFYDVINEYFAHKPKFYLGCNFGPYYSENFLNSFKNIFKQSQDLSFREQASKDILNIEDIRINPDIVFCMENIYTKTKKEKSVGFVLVDPRIKKTDKKIDYKSYIESFKSIVDFYLRKNYSIHFFSFCKTENDEAVINDILDNNNTNSAIELILYNGDINTFLEKYSAVEAIYCGRFHSMILSMIFNQKILPIIYGEKMTNILPDVSFKGTFIDISNIEKDVEVYHKYLYENEYDINELPQKANHHFINLDQLINKVN